MTRAPMTLMSHLWFAREGESYTLPGAGTVSRSSLPGSTDTVWAYLGIIGELNIEGPSEELEVWGSTAGRLVLNDVIPIKAQINLSFTCRELGPSGIEFIHRTAKLSSASSEFTPLAVAGIKGWLKCQLYDHEDTQQIITDNWVILKPNGALKADGASLAEAQFQARLLYSTLNNGGLDT